MKAIRLHALSGMVLAAFAGLHLCNHLFSIAGADKHIAVMNTLRPLYRSMIPELLLFGAVSVQIISGIKLVRNRRKYKQTMAGKWQVRTGLYLAIFLVVHVAAVVVGRYVLRLDTNIYFGVAGINHFPYNLFFIPYYALGVLALFGHLAALHYQKAKRVIAGHTPAAQAITIMILGLLLTAALFYGFTAGFTGMPIPNVYQPPHFNL